MTARAFGALARRNARPCPVLDRGRRNRLVGDGCGMLRSRPTHIRRPAAPTPTRGRTRRSMSPGPKAPAQRSVLSPPITAQDANRVQTCGGLKVPARPAVEHGERSRSRSTRALSLRAPSAYQAVIATPRRTQREPDHCRVPPTAKGTERATPTTVLRILRAPSRGGGQSPNRGWRQQRGSHRSNHRETTNCLPTNQRATAVRNMHGER